MPPSEPAPPSPALEAGDRSSFPSGFFAGAALAAAAAQTAWLPGVLPLCAPLHAAAATPVSPGLTAAMAAAGGGLAAWTGWAVDSWPRRTGLLLTAVALAVTQSVLTGRLYGRAWEPVSLILALTAGMTAAGWLAPAGSGLQRWFHQRAGRPLLQKLAQARSTALLVPDQREASVVTCRILNETQLREQLPARDFLKLMESFRTTASRLLMDRGALLDSPESGVVRGFFGLPLPSENPAGEAGHAGLLLAETMEQFAAARDLLNHPAVECGTGIASGTLTAGLAGETYTVAGDAVEQSRWLAGLNAEYGTRILTDGATHRLATGSEDRPLEILNPPEGAAVEVFQLLASAGGLSREALARRDAFRDAIMLLRAGHAGDARQRFEDARQGLIHGDAPLERFIAQAEAQAGRDGQKLPLPAAPRPRKTSRKIPRP